MKNRILRRFNVKYGEANIFLKNMNCLSLEASHKQLIKFQNSEEDIFLDGRGGKQQNTIYEDFPHLEIDANIFICDQLNKKDTSFTVQVLTRFISDQFYILTQEPPDDPEDLIIKEDLKRWDAAVEPNTKRPYFEGHERVDVVEARNVFVDYFLERKKHYYTVDESDPPKWMD